MNKISKHSRECKHMGVYVAKQQEVIPNNGKLILFFKNLLNILAPVNNRHKAPVGLTQQAVKPHCVFKNS